MFMVDRLASTLTQAAPSIIRVLASSSRDVIRTNAAVEARVQAMEMVVGGKLVSLLQRVFKNDREMDAKRVPICSFITR